MYHRKSIAIGGAIVAGIGLADILCILCGSSRTTVGGSTMANTSAVKVTIATRTSGVMTAVGRSEGSIEKSIARSSTAAGTTIMIHVTTTEGANAE